MARRYSELSLPFLRDSKKMCSQSQRQGKSGVVVVKTQQAILITHYPETVQPGQATNTVEQLGDYLIGVGY